MTAFPAILKPSRDDRPIFIAALFIVAILIAGTAYTWQRFGSAPLLSPNYLLQQLQIGAFLGIVAAGQMIVILIAQIDLSVPWTLTAAAMMATAVGGPWAIPIGLGVGLAVGLVNGIGVAYLRIPSMIFTLGTNAVMRGLMVAHTGGFAPDTHATPLMRALAAEHVLGIPNALFVWLAVSLILAVMLQRTVLGRAVYTLGNKEAAAYLAGVNTKGVTIICFAICGLTAAIAGVLLAGYSQNAYQGMGDAYLLPGDRRRRHRWDQYSRRPWTLPRHVRGGDPDRAIEQRALDYANAGSGAPSDLRRRHHPDAFGVRARRAGSGLTLRFCR